MAAGISFVGVNFFCLCAMVLIMMIIIFRHISEAFLIIYFGLEVLISNSKEVNS